jgi:hypothetical protein
MRSGDYFFSRWKGRLIHSGIHILSHLRLLVRWVFYSVLMGILVGFIGIAFVYAIQWATGFRLGHWWVIGLLPLGGLLIVWLYRISHDQNDKGTNMVLASLRAETELPVQMAPLIFVSTVVTHFCGGSAGREGAALQLGGSVGSVIGRLFRLAERDKQVLMLCGMSAAFSAIFRTPIAAPVFAIMLCGSNSARAAASQSQIPCADGLSRQRIHVTLRKPTKPRKEIAMMQPTPNETRTHTDELVDIRKVSVDKNLPKEERIAAFIRQIKNPYRFRCGDFVVNACFAGNGVTLEECLQGILR